MGGVSESGVCPRCGSLLPSATAPRPGRRRVWCSDSCRRAAHLERTGATLAGTAVRVVEVPRARPEKRTPPAASRRLSTQELADAVLGDRQALQLVLAGLTRQARTRTLDRAVRADAHELARVLLPNASRY